MTDPVAVPTEEYSRMYPLWNVTSTLRGGTPAMRSAGKTYLPQDPDESSKAYENRLSRSVLTNLYTRTVDKLVGKPLKKPVTIEEDVPNEVRPMLDDIDMLGTRLDVFANEILTAAVDDGLTHVLVDFAKTENTDDGEVPMADGSTRLSKRQIQAMGARPWARHVKAADLIGWKHEIKNGKKVLTQIRIYETAKVDTDEFTQETRERIRVWEEDRWRLYEKRKDQPNAGEPGDKEKWVIIDQGSNTLGVIPLVTLYTNQVGFMQAKPWLLDIAFLNVAHWQSDSDQRNLLHVARVPILFASGWGDDDTQWSITIGANSFSKAPKGAELKWVEHQGTGIEAGRNDLKDLEERIQLLGMEMLIKRPTGNTTATARALDQAEADSSLGMVAQSLENAIEEILDLFAQWMQLGEDQGGGSVSVFKDFGIEMAEAADLEILLKAKMAGEISQMTFLKELKRRGLLADDFDPQTEIDLLDIEGAGSATTDEPTDPIAMAEAGDHPDPEHPGRNKEGDVTGMVDGHRHTLEANGKMSTEKDDEGYAHTHTWDEFAIRTSVEDGHSHLLLSRAAQSKAPPPPPIAPPGADGPPGVPSDGNQPPTPPKGE